MLPGRAAARIAQRGGGPCQQGEDGQQFLGVARGQPPLGIDLAGAFPGEGLDRRIGQFGQPLKRQAGIDQPGQRLKTRQAGGRPAPAFRQEPGLPFEGSVEGIALLGLRPPQHKKRVIDPPDQPPPRQRRGPARPLPAPETVDPAPKPRLRRPPRPRIAHRSEVIEPRKTVQFRGKGGVRRAKVPHGGLRRGQQAAGKEVIARHQLPPPRERADGARLGRGGERDDPPPAPGRTPSVPAVQKPRPAGHDAGKINHIKLPLTLCWRLAAA